MPIPMPSEAVLRLMEDAASADNDAVDIQFTPAGVQHILDALPAGATHAMGGGRVVFRFNGRVVTVELDDERFEKENADSVTQDGLPKKGTSLDVLSRYFVIEAQGIDDDVERQDVERVLLDAMAEGPQPPPAAEGAGKRRRGKKTRASRKTKGGKKRKTLRRKK